MGADQSLMNTQKPKIVSLAPMMDWTDRHFRYFARLIAPTIRLYTEMISCQALIFGDRQRLLAFDPSEHPIALQVGGSCPQQLAFCAQLAEQFGYDEINLNVGCPSDRVQARIGACLMATPDCVAAGINAMKNATSIPVTVKTRIGVDDHDSYEHLTHFIRTVHQAGCQEFIIHARKAWLSGLSPKENRDIPPLNYPRVYQIKKDFPHLSISINGGINTLIDAKAHLKHVDGVMIGREAYQNPYFLAALESILSPDYQAPSREEIIERYKPYMLNEIKKDVRLHDMTRHLLGLFNHLPGARAWRRKLSTEVHQSAVKNEPSDFIRLL